MLPPFLNREQELASPGDDGGANLDYNTFPGGAQARPLFSNAAGSVKVMDLVWLDWDTATAAAGGGKWHRTFHLVR